MIHEIKHSEIESSNLNIRTHLYRVFLAGAISNSKNNWQREVIDYITGLEEKNEYKNKYDLYIYNPREYILGDKYFNDLSIDEIIDWDCNKMEHSNLFTFYFGNESNQTSTMFELGYILGKLVKENNSYTDFEKSIVISIDKDYNHRDKLIAYLKYVLGELVYNLVVEDSATIQEHTRSIYALYRNFIDEREELENKYYEK